MEKGKSNSVKERILEYLRSNPNEQFSQGSSDKQRLAERLGDPPLSLQTIGWVLWRLWKEGLIDSRKEKSARGKRIFFYKRAR